MTFHSFEISELTEEADNDYQIDVVVGDSRLGFCVKEAEMRMLADSMHDALDDVEDIDNRHAAENFYAEVSANGE